tara:strand:- start:707 stop:1393 length:687 start_codon:yes stop_codon:yes gene_type:complete
MGIRRGPSIVTEGLVFYADAANPTSYISGSSTVDSLIGDTTGSLINDTNFSTDNQGTWVFDGVDARILLNNTLDVPFTTQYWSVDIWFNHTINNGTYDAILGNGYPVQLFVQNSKIKSYLSSTPASPSYFLYNMTSTQAISTDTWYHLVWVRNGTNFYYYINGVLDKTQSATGTVANSNSNFNIGNLWDTNNTYTWKGEIGPSRIYNRALSSTEVLHNYNALKPRFGL